MKMKIGRIFPFLVLFSTLTLLRGADAVRINQLGYLPDSVKIAVFISTDSSLPETFTVRECRNGSVVFKSASRSVNGGEWGFKSSGRLDFSEIESPGRYYIKCGEARSPDFRIGTGIYHGVADFILNYLRRQRCGFNPLLRDSCHQFDGIIVDHPSRTGEKIDVTGGWHDASDYLQYSTTSVNTVFQLMFAYQRYPALYPDEHDDLGLEGANRIPDILDEIRWGLKWMLKMNPGPKEIYNQIADDRDHVGYRLPNQDQADYGLGRSRPVYFVTGRPQGLSKHRNNTTGVSSIAAKFSSGFARGALLFRDTDPDFANLLEKKAVEAWKFALEDLGFTQTACYLSPYFYEESNYVDDLELAGTQLYLLTKNREYLKQATAWGEKEPITPWMETGDARHYQYYPFVNLGHHFLIQQGQDKFIEFYARGLEFLYQRGKDDPFLNGIPFIWCSNNLVAAALTQMALYFDASGDARFREMEASLRDWLFGCNPWGTAMICGLPKVGDSPMNPHSSFTVLLGETTLGGLVDGPVRREIFEGLIGIELNEKDEYAPFNQGKAVYHDDTGDYSTNEPTLDGTAGLSFYLARLEDQDRDDASETMKK